MRAEAILRLDDGSERRVGHGDLLGRLWSAAVCLDDPSISEMHAAVSLRGQELRLLAMRGRFVVDERPATEVSLTPGQRIRLSHSRWFDVVDVTLPGSVLALEGPGLERQVLAGVTSVRVEPRVHLSADAAALFWSIDGDWRVRVGDSPPRELGFDDVIDVGGVPLRAVAVPLAQAGGAVTRLQDPRMPLHLMVHHDTAHIHREREAVVSVSGAPARILSELAAFDGPVGWEVLASEVWRDEPDRGALRRRLDITLSRLRGRLRDARVRTDLVRADGTGSIELVLYPDDRLTRETLSAG